MRKPAIKYTAGEIGRPKVIEDVLAPPDALVVRGNHLEKTRRRVGKAKRAHHLVQKIGHS